MLVNNVNVALNELNADYDVIFGVLGIQCNESVDDKVSGKPISGLNIVSKRNNEKPIYHSSTHIYGFIKLQHGLHKLYIKDPQQHYLPRTIKVNIPKYETRDVLKRLNSVDPHSQQLMLVETKLYPSIQYPVRNGNTSIWGTINDKNNRPCAFCYLEIESVRDNIDGVQEHTKVKTYSDLNGDYLLLLPGEKVDFLSPDENGGIGANSGNLIQQYERKITVYALKQNPVLKKEPLSAFPEDFDNENFDIDQSNSPYKKSIVELHEINVFENKDTVLPTNKIPVDIGKKKRIDIQLIDT